jgi:gliding motility-associated-like protein
MGKHIYFKSFLHFCMIFMPLITVGQNVVIKGGGVVVEPSTFWVIQGNLTVKEELSNGKINLDGTILLNGDITNETQDIVFDNQEPVPNGWVVMPNATTAQRIKGNTPISFENLSLSGAEKILENSNSSTNGLIRLNAVFNLNRRNFILNNKDYSALEHFGGYLFAETNPVDGIGSFQWNISNNVGIYQIPFGSGQVDTSDIAVDYQPLTAGSSTGGIVFSTYPTDNTNTPFPDLVYTMAPYQPMLTMDRFWLLDAGTYTQKPLSSFTLRYTDSDIEHGSKIVKDKLKPISYKSSDIQWAEYPQFNNDILGNSMTVLNVNAISFDKNWTITSDDASIDIYFPNAFTPDFNGDNETFKPVMDFIPKTYIMYIYNRWGNLVYTSQSPAIGWDGRYLDADCQIGTYAWTVVLVKPNGKEYHYAGHVSVIK